MATEMGKIASLWRYPVKSIIGEELLEAELTEYGLVGDRAYALIDAADGMAATAKNPGKWPTLFECRATFVDLPHKGAAPPAVRITLPDGSTLSSSAGDCHQRLSNALKRTVTLATADRGRVSGVQASLPASWTGKAEEYWPDMEGLDHRDTITDFILRRSHRPSAHHRYAQPPSRRVSQRPLRSPPFSSEHCGGHHGAEARVRRTNLDRADGNDRRRAAQHHRILRPLCHDHPRAGRPAER
jgi:hypothetical protein